MIAEALRGVILAAGFVPSSTGSLNVLLREAIGALREAERDFLALCARRNQALQDADATPAKDGKKGKMDLAVQLCRDAVALRDARYRPAWLAFKTPMQLYNEIPVAAAVFPIGLNFRLRWQELSVGGARRAVQGLGPAARAGGAARPSPPWPPRRHHPPVG